MLFWLSGARGVTWNATELLCLTCHIIYDRLVIWIPQYCYQNNNGRWTACRGAFASCAHFYCSSNASKLAEHHVCEQKYVGEVGSDMRQKGTRTLDTVDADVVWICAALGRKNFDIENITHVSRHASCVKGPASIPALLLPTVPAQRRNNMTLHSRFRAFTQNAKVE